MNPRKSHVLLSLLLLPLLTACEVYLSGDNSQGQLGIAGAGDPPGGTMGWASTSQTWVKLETEVAVTCGINPQTELWCWGDNSRGQMGNGVVGGNQETPARVGTQTGWQHVAPGFRHVCGIRNNELYCWGTDGNGELGTGFGTTTQSTPQRVGTASDWIHVATGTRHSCGIRGPSGATQLYCWGDNGEGQIGNNTTNDAHSPVLIPSPGPSTPWTYVDAGYIHTCASTSFGLTCWGSNDNGQLGSAAIPLGSNQLVPGAMIPPPTGSTWDTDSLSAGREASCALVNDPLFGFVGPKPQKLAYCWGSNAVLQMATIFNAIITEPEELGKLCSVGSPPLCFGTSRAAYSQVSVGGFHVCAVKTASITSFRFVQTIEAVNDIDCMGSNDDGQLNIRNLPGMLGASQTIIDVSSGQSHSAALVYSE